VTVERLATTLGFLALSALAILVHLRRTRSAPPRRCPRCDEPLGAGPASCPRCGVPLQVFELSAAPAVPRNSVEAATGGAAHAVVRADVCVGCAACVPVCPEEGAIRLEGKLAVVDAARCRGHGRCVEACPVGGILLATGAEVHRVEVPDVRLDFQSNVPGIYVVGELGGRGLIKNAINEGKLAAENVARELACQAARRDPQALDVAIVGGGPAGLSAGLEAHRAGLRYAILEQGTLADSIRRYPRHKLVLGEPVRVPLWGDLWIADATKETLLRVWESVVEGTGLDLRTQHRVEAIVRDGAHFALRGEGFELRARKVILALGRRGTPRRLGVAGEDSGKVFYDIVEMDAFRGRRVLVVGGGDSALESAVGLATQPRTEVALSHRGQDFPRAKERNVARLRDAEASGSIRVLRESAVTSIEQDRVTLALPDGPMVLPNDIVIVRIGGEPPDRFLSRIGIGKVVKELPLEKARDAVAP
jgi:thioredoxin reductase